MSDPRPEKPIQPTPLEHTPTAPSTAATLVAEAFGTFLLVLGVISTALFAAGFGEGTEVRQQGRRLPRRLARRRPHGRRRRLRLRPDLGRALQPRRHPRPRRGRPLPVEQVDRLHHRPDHRRRRRDDARSCSSACSGPTTGCSNAQDGGFASNGWDALSPGGFGIGGAIVVEVLFTALFVIVILGVTHPTRGNPAFAGLVIGLTLTLIHLATIPIDNTSVNPARSIATAIYGGGDALLPAVGVHRVPDRRCADRRLRLPRPVRQRRRRPDPHAKSGSGRRDRAPLLRARGAVSRRRASACRPRTR